MIDLVMTLRRGKRGYVIVPLYCDNPPEYTLTVLVLDESEVLNISFSFTTKEQLIKELKALKDEKVKKEFIDNVENQLSKIKALPNESQQKPDIRKP